MPASRTTSTAPVGLRRRMTRNRASSGRTSAGAVAALSNGATTKRSSTPASIAAATAVGRRRISVSRGRNAAVSRTRAPASRKAPTAAGSPIAPPVAAISAAPGVDQAVMIGWRWRRLSQLLVAAMARQSAVTQEEVCAGSAPTARAAATTIANVPPKPTMAATTAETMIDRRTEDGGGSR